MTILQIVQWISDALFAHGAHHLLSGTQGHNGFLASKRFLVTVCRIPAHLHGARFTCTGWIRRP